MIQRDAPLDGIFRVEGRNSSFRQEVAIVNLVGDFIEVYLNTPEEVRELINKLEAAASVAFV